MGIGSGIWLMPVPGASTRTGKPAWRTVLELIGTPDFATIAVFLVVGLTVSIWLTVQFPVAESTAAFLANYG
jgi:hypothetical protein